MGLSRRAGEMLEKYKMSDWRSTFVFEDFSALVLEERVARLPDGPPLDDPHSDSVPQTEELQGKLDPADIATLADVKVTCIFCHHCDKPREVYRLKGQACMGVLRFDCELRLPGETDRHLTGCHSAMAYRKRRGADPSFVASTPSEICRMLKLPIPDVSSALRAAKRLC